MEKLKLNKKGFTLIELLAVIVILAIVMTVTIPTVLSSMNNARKNQLQNAADTVGSWINEQYVLYDVVGGLTGSNSDVDSYFKTWIASASTNGTKVTLTDELLKAAGLNGGQTNATGTAEYLSSYKKWCIRLTAVDGGSYNGAGTATTDICPE